MKRGDKIKEAGTTSSCPVEGGPLAIREMVAGHPFALRGGRETPTLCFVLHGHLLIKAGSREYPLTSRELFALLPKQRIEGRALDDSLLVECRLEPRSWVILCEYMGPSLLMSLGHAPFQTLVIHPYLFDELMLYVRVRRDGKIPLGRYLFLKREQILILLRQIYPAGALASLFG